MAEGIEKAVGDLDPERCKSSTCSGACPNKAVPGMDFCKIHGGEKQLNAAKKAEHDGYRVAKWRASIERFATPDHIKNLTEEIAILKVLLEEVLQQCHTSVDLVMNQGPISNLVNNISNVVNSFDKMQTRMGTLLNKSAIMNIAVTIVGILTQELKHEPELLAKVSEKIYEAVVIAQNPNDKGTK